MAKKKRRKRKNKVLRRVLPEKPITTNTRLNIARSAILPAELIYPTPLITKWVKWVNARNHRPQPEIALGSVLAGMSTIMGRNLTWMGKGGNIYTLGLAMSASGKDACKCGVQEVMSAVGLEERLCNGAFNDDKVFFDQLSENKELLVVSDEFHAFMDAIDERRNPKVTAPIVKMLLDAFSGDVAGICKRGRALPDIVDPYLNLFAMCQPSVFWKLCKLESIENGFLGRFIIINGRVMPNITIASMAPPPTDLIAELRSGFERMPGKREIAASQECIDLTNRLTLDFDVEYTQKAVHVENNPIKGSLYARSMEKSNRLALIHAWSLCPSNPVMTIESIKWGYDFMMHCNKFTLAGINGKITDNRIAMTEAKIIIRLMQAGKGGCFLDELNEAMELMPKFKRKPLLIDMEAAGRVVSRYVKVTKETSPNGKLRLYKYWLGKSVLGNALPSYVIPSAEERKFYEEQKSISEAEACES